MKKINGGNLKGEQHNPEKYLKERIFFVHLVTTKFKSGLCRFDFKAQN